MAKQTISELEHAVRDAMREELEARDAHGEFSRPFLVARDIRMRAERFLSAAEHEQKERQRQNAMTPEQIVDEAMRR